MAITFAITQTPLVVPLQHSRSPVTLTNNAGSASTLYYRLRQPGTDDITFAGNAGAIAGLAHGLLAVGEKIALPSGLGTLDVACATAGTATLDVAMGVAV